MFHFSDYPLVWMYHRRSKNNKIKGLHERCVRIIKCDKNSTFEELLDEYGSVTIHNRNWQFVAFEMFKITKKKQCSHYFHEIFEKYEQSFYNLRNTNGLQFSRKFIIFRPQDTEYVESLLEFKTKRNFLSTTNRWQWHQGL